MSNTKILELIFFLLEVFFFISAGVYLAYDYQISFLISLTVALVLALVTGKLIRINAIKWYKEHGMES